MPQQPDVSDEPPDEVWLHVSMPFVGGVCKAVQPGGQIQLKMDGGSEQTVDLAKGEVLAGNEEGLTAHDHCALIHLNEPCILENTSLRYKQDKIYTYTGKILVALNPFGPLKSVYGDDVMAK